MNTKYIEEVKKSEYVIKAFNKLIGLKLNGEDYDFAKNRGGINLLVSSLTEEVFFNINLGTAWLFIFSEIIDFYNKADELDFYSYQWELDKNRFRNEETYRIRISFNSKEETVLTLSNLNEKNLSIVLDRDSMFEIISKIIEIVQKVKKFKFSFINLNNENRKLSIAKIESKCGTIITTYNGIEFGKPYLSESDKYQIKYSSINRLLYGRWLSVHAERINISVEGIITTVDEEYILDKSPKNKSTLAALVLLASLSFRNIEDEN